ncbi:hypothetical protein [Brachybacterium alimentarium]|uniref:hypothetical protein n=1 Tax=Brachybacterium alimentarium TaxID=47845 RepID=UPI003FD202EB
MSTETSPREHPRAVAIDPATGVLPAVRARRTDVSGGREVGDVPTSVLLSTSAAAREQAIDALDAERTTDADRSAAVLKETR